jgi:hypothetical protein
LEKLDGSTAQLLVEVDVHALEDGASVGHEDEMSPADAGFTNVDTGARLGVELRASLAVNVCGAAETAEAPKFGVATSELSEWSSTTVCAASRETVLDERSVLDRGAPVRLGQSRGEKHRACALEESTDASLSDAVLCRRVGSREALGDATPGAVLGELV